MAFFRHLAYTIKQSIRRRKSGPSVDPAQRMIERKTAYWQEPTWANRHLMGVGERPQSISIPILLRVLEYMPAGSKVLDVGCGHGRYTIPFAENGHTAVGTDVSQEMLTLLDKAKGDLPLETRLGDAHHLNAADGEFDVVFSNDFIGHFPNWAVLLKEQARVCRPGGRIMLSMAFRENQELAAKMDGKEFEHDYSPDIATKRPYWADASHEEIVRAGKEAGLTIKALHPLKFFNDNYLFGRAFGTERYRTIKQDLSARLKADPAVQEFYTWLEMKVPQELSFYVSNLTLVVYEKDSV